MNQEFSLKGRSFDTNRLFIESDTFTPCHVLNILNGTQAGVVFRNYLSKIDSSIIANNFWNHPNRYNRDKDVPASCVGVFHYNKSLDDYLEEAYLSNLYLDSLFDGVDVNPINQLMNALNTIVSKTGSFIRIATHNGKHAARFVARSWEGTDDEYSLLPHEDLAQCLNPLQQGFEIQKTASRLLIAVNLCLEITGGGMLRYWNIIPDNDSRERLGLTFTGIPYPLKYLANVDYQDICIEPGDLYLFNSSAVHAVTNIYGEKPQRATISFFIGQLTDNKQFIYWA